MMTSNSKQPLGLYFLFATEMWERFSFHGMRALLVLYMSSAISQGGFGWDNSFCLKIYSSYLALAYFTPILGGYLADNYLGQKRSALIGGILMALGHLIMTYKHEYLFFTAIALVCLGNGFFKPNITAMLGLLYEQNDPRRSSGFSIFYMGINIGAMLASLSIGLIQQHYGFDSGFLVAAIGMIIGWIILISCPNHHLSSNQINFSKCTLLKPKSKPTLSFQEIDRLWVIVMISMATFVFMIAFGQSGGLIQLFINHWTDRHLGSYLIPSACYLSLNPLFGLLWAPLMSFIWAKLEPTGSFVSIKLALGLIFTSLGFFILTVVTPTNLMQFPGSCHSLWLVPFYALITLGEICILPVLWAAISQLSPTHLVSSMMAFALFTMGLGGYCAGQLASFVDLIGPKYIFAIISINSFGMGLSLFLLTPHLKRWSHGAH
jgi:POT family proton-dependent oligopeptide transporter